MPTRARTFSDLNLKFSPHPMTRDISKVYDENSINQSLRNLVLTRNYERPFRSEIGSQVTALLFENVNPMTTVRLQKTIENVIESFEPRVVLLGVEVLDRADNNAYAVNIAYVIRNTQSPRNISLTLERSR